MFSGNKGAKGGKRDLKISLFNKKKKKKQKELEKEKIKKNKQQEEKRKKLKIPHEEIKPIEKEEIIFTPRRKRKVGIITEERKKQEEIKEKEIPNQKQVDEKVNKDQEKEEQILEKRPRKKIGISPQEPDKEIQETKEVQPESKEIVEKQIEDAKEEKEEKEEEKEEILQEVSYSQKRKKQKIAFTNEPSHQQEADEAFLELKVMTEIENLLKENQYQLDKLIIEYQILEQESEELIYLKDAESMSLEIESLLIRLEKIKQQIEVLIETTDLENIYQLEDHYFTYLIDHYKATIQTQGTIENKVDDMKHSPDYISIIQKIIEFEKERDFLQQQVEEKVKNLELRDKDFDQLKTTYIHVEKTTEYLKTLIKDAEQNLKQIQEKVNRAVHVTERVETQMKYSLGILTRTLLLIQLTKKMPLKQTIGMNAIETIVAMNLIRNLLKPKQIQKVIRECDIEDYQTEIIRAINDTNSVYQLVEDSLTSIKNLKNTFQKDFSEYQDSIPEYKELLDMIEKTESTMKEKQEDMKRIQNDMSYQLEKNNEKVKHYEEII